MAKKVGRYEISEKIGQGGMGTVYKAFDPLLRRTVAIKLITAVLEEKSETRERFFREARAAGQLAHRNIIVIYDLGEEAGQPFLAMEYLSGSSLETRMSRGGRVSTERALAIAIDVCDALEYAHARGVVHRDVKPANIFVTDADEVKILDFGLAHLVASDLTRSETIMGTANYMAPEQVRGERVDRRVDVFAVGVVLYELLTGRRAFEGDSFANTLYKVLETSPAPLHEHDPTLPRPVVAVVERALAKRRDDRYQTIGDMQRDLIAARESLTPSHRQLQSTASMPTVALDTGAVPGEAPGSGKIDGSAPKAGVASDAHAHVAPVGSVIWSPRRVRTTALVGGVLAAAAAAALFGPLAGDRPVPAPSEVARTDPAAVKPERPATPPDPSPAAPATSSAEPAAERGPAQSAAAPPPEPRSAPAPSAPAPRAAAPAAQQISRAAEPRTSAADRARADEALNRVAGARSLADTSGAPALAAAAYRIAISTEGEARGLYAAGEFARAAARAGDAEAMFRNVEAEARATAAAREAARAEPIATPPAPAATPPVRQPVPEPAAAEPSPPAEPPAPAVDPRDAIRGVIAQYVAGLEGRSLPALRAIWPSLGGAQERAMRAEFENARSIQVRLENTQIDVTGQTAVIVAMRQYDLVTVDGQRLASRTRMTLRMRLADSAWVIESVAYQ